MNKIKLVILCLFLFIPCISAHPVSYLIEEVNASFFYNGSLRENITKIGYIEIDTGNQKDVLQYILINLSSTTGTNLLSPTIYKSVAASPYPGDKTRVYMNTTEGEKSLHYVITDSNLIPIINLKIEYKNWDGGRDLHPDINIIFFNITLNSTHNLSFTTFVFQAAKNIYGNNDSLNIFDESATSGVIQRSDSDGDGFYDKLFWNGSLHTGKNVYITFNATIIPQINFDESIMYINPDSSESCAHYSNSQTFTGIQFIDRFSRGPIRQGLEMIKSNNNWIVRGFIKNIAKNISYIVHGWKLYEVGNTTPLLASSSEEYLQPNETLYTDWYNTENKEKHYYTTAFDWEIIWDSPVYAAHTTSKITIPEFYEIDAWVDKTVTLTTNTPNQRIITITDRVRHLGHAALSVNHIIINSSIPHLSTNGTGVSWNVQNVSVYYFNGTKLYEVTSGSDITVKNPDISSDGFVNVEIKDVASLTGKYLTQNNDIILIYQLVGTPSENTQTYQFFQSSTLFTLSGTPVTKNITVSLTVPGVQISLPAPSPPGAPSAEKIIPIIPPYADIIKEKSDSFILAPGMANIHIVYRIIDSGKKGVKDVKVLVYLPEKGKMSNLQLMLFDKEKNEWRRLIFSKDYSVTENLTFFEEKKMKEYLIYPGVNQTGFHLFDGDKIKIIYTVKIPFGTHAIITRAAGYDIYEDRYIFEDAYIWLRNEKKIEELKIKETDWMQKKAFVGKPVEWIKRINIYNPNEFPVRKPVTISVFPDTLTAYLIDIKREKLQLKGERNPWVEISPRIQGKETKTVYLQIFTPPVLETDRKIQILNKTGIKVILKTNITLKNMAHEIYTNVSYIFPIRIENIINSTLKKRKEGNKTEFIIKEMHALETLNFIIVYQEIPPVLLAFIPKEKYGCEDVINFTIFMVPTEKERSSYIEVELIGPKPKTKTAYADLLCVSGIEAYEEVKIPVQIFTHSLPGGEYILYTKLQKDFGSILSEIKEIKIECPRKVTTISWLLIIFAAIGAGVYLLIRMLMPPEDELKRLKKEIRKLKF